ncbi:unnamed protein product [Gordionus sp. m RMFG-2023]|uniref:la-related protein 7 homolog n=1 Tax=Gordionus sp. m RMFG-2023 TaxID=3053472 RepID=UPI0030DF3926
MPVNIKKLKNQIEFYFSETNLRRDKYLRNLLGPSLNNSINISELLNFNKVTNLTKNIQDVIRAIIRSNKFELNDDKTYFKLHPDFLLNKGIYLSDKLNIKSYDEDLRTIFIRTFASSKIIDIDLIKDWFSYFGTVLYVKIIKKENINDSFDIKKINTNDIKHAYIIFESDISIKQLLKFKKDGVYEFKRKTHDIKDQTHKPQLSNNINQDIKSENDDQFKSSNTKRNNLSQEVNVTEDFISKAINSYTHSEKLLTLSVKRQRHDCPEYDNSIHNQKEYFKKDYVQINKKARLTMNNKEFKFGTNYQINNHINHLKKPLPINSPKPNSKSNVNLNHSNVVDSQNHYYKHRRKKPRLYDKEMYHEEQGHHANLLDQNFNKVHQIYSPKGRTNKENPIYEATHNIADINEPIKLTKHRNRHHSKKMGKNIKEALETIKSLDILTKTQWLKNIRKSKYTNPLEFHKRNLSSKNCHILLFHTNSQRKILCSQELDQQLTLLGLQNFKVYLFKDASRSSPISSLGLTVEQSVFQGYVMLKDKAELDKITSAHWSDLVFTLTNPGDP